MGHTEDAMSEILNHVYIVSAEIIDDSGQLLEKFTTFSYAGHLMGYTMGFNEEMIYSVNTLFPSIHNNGSRMLNICKIIIMLFSFICMHINIYSYTFLIIHSCTMNLQKVKTV